MEKSLFLLLYFYLSECQNKISKKRTKFPCRLQREAEWEKINTMSSVGGGENLVVLSVTLPSLHAMVHTIKPLRRHRLAETNARVARSSWILTWTLSMVWLKVSHYILLHSQASKTTNRKIRIVYGVYIWHGKFWTKFEIVF